MRRRATPLISGAVGMAEREIERKSLNFLLILFNSIASTDVPGSKCSHRLAMEGPGHRSTACALGYNLRMDNEGGRTAPADPLAIF